MILPKKTTKFKEVVTELYHTAIPNQQNHELTYDYDYPYTVVDANKNGTPYYITVEMFGMGGLGGAGGGGGGAYCKFKVLVTPAMTLRFFYSTGSKGVLFYIPDSVAPFTGSPLYRILVGNGSDYVNGGAGGTVTLNTNSFASDFSNKFIDVLINQNGTAGASAANGGKGGDCYGNKGTITDSTNKNGGAGGYTVKENTSFNSAVYKGLWRVILSYSELEVV